MPSEISQELGRPSNGRCASIRRPTDQTIRTSQPTYRTWEPSSRPSGISQPLGPPLSAPSQCSRKPSATPIHRRWQFDGISFPSKASDFLLLLVERPRMSAIAEVTRHIQGLLSRTNMYTVMPEGI